MPLFRELKKNVTANAKDAQTAPPTKTINVDQAAAAIRAGNAEREKKTDEKA